MQYVLPCGPYSRGNQANMYLQQRITLQQNPHVLHLLSAQAQIFVSNIILWYPSPKSIPAWKTSGWTGEDKSCCCLYFQHQLEVHTLCDRQDFLVAQICTGMQGIFYINTEWIVVPAQTHFQFPPPVFPGQWNYSKLYLWWLKQMLSYCNRRDFHTGLRLFSSHTKILPPIREPSCSASGKLI